MQQLPKYDDSRQVAILTCAIRLRQGTRAARRTTDGQSHALTIGGFLTVLLYVRSQVLCGNRNLLKCLQYQGILGDNLLIILLAYIILRVSIKMR